MIIPRGWKLFTAGYAITFGPKHMEDAAKSPTSFSSVPDCSLAEENATRELSSASVYCPVCFRRLQQHKCKLICAACGYYMSCSDYY
jgi:hypothetical protein